MAFEKNSLIHIKEKFEDENFAPTMWWQHGVLWADTNSKDDVELIKEGLEEYISSDYKVSVNCLKATKTEPWNQYAFDIVEA